MNCHCGGLIAPSPSGLDVSSRPSLSGLMLACTSCGRPIRLLHRRAISQPKLQHRRDLNRALRATRRMQMRHGG